MLAAEKAVAVREDDRKEFSKAASRQLIERLSDARQRSDALFKVVRPGSLYERPIPERHRIIFYLGHLEAFDWNLLSDSVLGLRSLTPEFDRLFAFGIDPVGGGLPADLPSDWPAVDSVLSYVNNIRSVLDQQLEKRTLESNPPTRDGFPLRTLLDVAIEHRLMHVETLAYMLHQLPPDMKIQELESTILAGPPVAHRMVPVPSGEATLGLPRGTEDFGWDNEYEMHAVTVPAFEIDQFKVTNQQYLEFMVARGYETRAFWTDDDWKWKAEHGISHPLFWEPQQDGRWFCRTMFERVPLPLDWPVYVSQAEASAYARWAGTSLPTEAEWQRAAYSTLDGDARPFPWGNEAPHSRFGNFGLERWDPTPVNAFPKGQSAFGVHDLLGNGWEWTSTVFGPFPGFEPFPFYRGYSADFFDGKHFVMKGGSARTAACMLRSTFRNWFQAHYNTCMPVSAV
jgi:iron(II)-dependent oxidoreductase